MTPSQQQQLDDTGHRIINGLVGEIILWVVAITVAYVTISFLWNFFSPYFAGDGSRREISIPAEHETQYRDSAPRQHTSRVGVDVHGSRRGRGCESIDCRRRRG